MDNISASHVTTEHVKKLLLLFCKIVGKIFTLIHKRTHTPMLFYKLYHFFSTFKNNCEETMSTIVYMSHHGSDVF